MFALLAKGMWITKRKCTDNVESMNVFRGELLENNYVNESVERWLRYVKNACI